jgi:hypothetical protein
MTEPLFRVDIAEKEINAIPFKPQFSHLQNFMKNDELQGEIARIEIDRIEVNKEDVIASCGDLFFRIISKKTEKNAEISYNPFVIAGLCHGEPPSYIHFHGPYLGWQSVPDAIANKSFFADGVIMSCAAGIDGVHCRTSTHDIRIPWADNFYDKLKEEHGWGTFKDVQSISCSKIRKPASRVNWMCDIKFKDGKGSYSNMFDEVNFEHSKAEDNSAPYTVLEDREGNPPEHTRYPKSYNHVYDDGDDVACTVIDARNNSKRMLMCFKRSW